MKGIAKTNMSKYVMGLTISIGTILVGIASLSYFLINDKIGQGSVVPTIYLIQSVSSVLGTCTAIHKIKAKRIRVMIVMGAMLMLLALSSGLFMDGEFKSVLVNLGAIWAGCLISYVICCKSDRTVRKKKHRHR